MTEFVMRPVSLADATHAALIQREMLQDSNFRFFLEDFSPEESFANYVQRLADTALGKNLREGHVPATFLVAEIDRMIAGRVSIRHELNDFLLHQGGHIGYGVRPQFRGRGLATAMLRHGIQHLQARGVHRILVTCDDTNIASATVIEKCGGVLENIIEVDGELLRRYWITADLQDARQND
jgi:predicted acetyltransferase